VNTVECVRERQVVRAVLTRTWPCGAGDDLRLHAETCEVCLDAVALAAAFGNERDDALRDVRLPAAGQVWWRAAARAHREAQQAARRPMIWLQGIAGACAVGLAAALLGLAWPSMREALAWIADLGPALQFYRPVMAPLVAALQPAMPLALAIVACLVLTPIVVYFALSDD
jgi:hypothetical protein